MTHRPAAGVLTSVVLAALFAGLGATPLLALAPNVNGGGARWAAIAGPERRVAQLPDRRTPGVTIAAAIRADTAAHAAEDGAALGFEARGPVFASTAVSTTYLADVLAGGGARVRRWDDRRGAPVRVWLGSGDTLVGWRPEFGAAVRGAFAEWEGVGVPVRFAFVDEPAQAEVQVEWTSRLGKQRAGEIRRRSDARGWLVGARIVLALTASDGRPASVAGTRRIALHEIGHLLGLEHSPDAGDVMAAWVTTAELTDRDRATVRALYTLPPGAVADATPQGQ